MGNNLSAKNIGFWKRFITIFEGIGVDPNDTDSIKLQKAILVASAVTMASLAILWGIFFIALGVLMAASIPLSYSILSFISVFLFKINRKQTFFRNSQLILSMFLPFLLMLTLGGFTNSGVMILWSLSAPFGALLFADHRKAHYWFGLYIILVFVSGILEYYLSTDPVISEFSNLFLFVMNIVGISFVIFLIVYYFVEQKTKAFDLLYKLANKQFSNLIDNLDFEKQIQDETTKITPILFMLISPSGLATYSKFFSKKEKFNDQLISGFLTALNAFSEETFGTNFLKQITYKEFRLIFDISNNFRFVYAFKGDQKTAKINFYKILNHLNSNNYKFVFASDFISLNDNDKLNELVETNFT